MRYRTHNRRRRLGRQLKPSIRGFDLCLTEEEVLADLGFAYTRIPSNRRPNV
jgi:hypothetical protein